MKNDPSATYANLSYNIYAVTIPKRYSTREV